MTIPIPTTGDDNKSSEVEDPQTPHTTEPLADRIASLVDALRKTTSALRGSEAQRARVLAEHKTLKAAFADSELERAQLKKFAAALKQAHEALIAQNRAGVVPTRIVKHTEKAPPLTELYIRQQNEIDKSQFELAELQEEIKILREQLDSALLKNKAETDAKMRNEETTTVQPTTSAAGSSERSCDSIQSDRAKTLDEAHLKLIEESALFDSDYYLERYPELKSHALNPAQHYLKLGGKQGRNPHALFDSKFYLSTYKDVAEDGVNPLVHFLQFGAKQGYDPNPLFISSYYRNTNPDVSSSGANELEHYVRHGAWEGRDPNPLFQSEYYLKQYPELRNNNNVTPLQHYMNVGWLEGANPHPLFWNNFYLDTNPDVTESAQPPLVHFLRFGHAEGRDPNPVLHGRWYLETYPDAASIGIFPHFSLHGITELLDPSPVFSTTMYLDINPSVTSSGHTALEDLLNRARAEYQALPHLRPSPLRLWWRDQWNSKSLDAKVVTPKVSVIIPCYNQGEFLEDAILSVLISKVPVEVIVVDDGSTNAFTIEQIQRLERAYSIRVVRRANGGLAAARNSGLACAACTFIQFLDADDVLLVEKLPLQLAQFESNPELMVSVAEYVLSNAYLASWYKAQPSTLQDFDFTHDEFLHFWERGLSIPIHCALFRKSCLEGITFDESVRAKEDWIFWLELSKKKVPMSLLKNVLAIYRQHGLNMSSDTIKMGHEFLSSVIHICKTENSGDFLEQSLKHYENFYIPLIKAQSGLQQRLERIG